MNSLKKVITSLMATLMIICAFGGSVFAASLNGWVKSKYGGWYYYKNGERLTSQWLKDGSYWYYLDEDGIMLSDSETYIGDKYYGFDEDGHWYYSCDFNDKGEKLFYDLSGKTVFVRCSKEDGWYYYDGSMYPLRGWVKLFDEWYYCDNNGKAAVGWRDIGGSRYYFDSEGIMYSGGIWEFVDEDTRYCFDDNGKLRTGWFNLNEYWFYADEEWQYIAAGDEKYLYPWGNLLEDERCNGLSGELMPVDAFENGASPFGVMDLCGNCHEWTNTVYDDGMSLFTLLRGGSCLNTKNSMWHMDGGVQPNTHHQKFYLLNEGQNRSEMIGFRCVWEEVR